MITRNSPDLSIIIVNYHSETSLKTCLSYIEYDPLPAQVIVVDNGSTATGCADIVTMFPEVCWLPMNTNEGFGRGCNRGARDALSRKLLFLNPDTRLVAGALVELDKLMDRPNLANSILGCAIYNDDGTVQLSCRRFPTWATAIANRYSLLTKLRPNGRWSTAYLMTDFDHRQTFQVDWVSGAAMAMNSHTFDVLNGFDDDYFLYCEDIDICKRGDKLGISTWYCPDVGVLHSIGGSSRHSMVRALMHRHHSIWKYYRHFYRRLLLDAPVAVFLMTRFVVTATLAVWAGKEGGIRNVPYRQTKSAAERD